MVWCGLTSGGLLGPYFFTETVTGPVYKQMLVDYAWPYLKRKRLYFQHDGAGPLFADAVRNWLDEKFPGRWIGRREPFRGYNRTGPADKPASVIPRFFYPITVKSNPQ